MGTRGHMRIVSLFSVIILVATFAPQGEAYAGERPGSNSLQLHGLDSLVSGIISSVTVESSTGGGVSASSEAVSSGDSDASASVRNMIQSVGRGTQVRIDVRAESDGVSNSATVSKTMRPGERAEVRIATSTDHTSVRAAVSLEGTSSRPSEDVPPRADEFEHSTSSPSWAGSVFRTFERAFSAMVKRLFFWRNVE